MPLVGARSINEQRRTISKSPSGEMADAADSKSAGAFAPCRFESDLGHHFETVFRFPFSGSRFPQRPFGNRQPETGNRRPTSDHGDT